MKNICERLHLPVSIGTKPTTFTLAAMSEPLFAQNYFGLTLELCIAFIAEDFAWFHFERFQSTKVRQFCLRLRVIGEVLKLLSAMLQTLHFTFSILLMVIKLKRKIHLSGRYSTQTLKISHNILKKRLPNCLKKSNNRCSLIYVLCYKEIISSLFFSMT